MKGTFYDALKDFPITITINLMVSLIIAVTIIPLLEVRIIRPDKVKTGGNAITNGVQRIYNHVLDFTFRHPWITILTGIVVILLSSLIVNTLKIRLFPYADRDQFAVEIFLPEGRGLAETERIAETVYQELKKDANVVGITSFIGCSSPRFMDAYAPQMPGKNYAQFIVNTKSNKATLELLAKYQPMFGESFPNAYVKFKRLDYLEVNELEYRFYGDNIDSLHVVAERLIERMREMPEVEWVHTDYLQPYPIVNVQLDPVASAQLGVTRTGAQLTLGAMTSDLKVGEVWEGNYDVPIVVKDDAVLSFSSVGDIGIATTNSILAGNIEGKNTTVPLRQVAKVAPSWSESRIMHRGGERCITGNEALPQIFWGITIAIIIIFFFLLFNFKKFGITLVCIAALGLMTPGTLIGLGLMDRDLGLTSIFGLITLMGIIMRNEILIFEHANDLIKKYIEEHGDWKVDRKAYNKAVKQAAYDAGKRRMVPIFLTTATTAVGVVPMIIAQSSFWMPVGVTIFAGGIGSLIMVVTMLPVIYWKVNMK